MDQEIAPLVALSTHQGLWLAQNNLMVTDLKIDLDHKKVHHEVLLKIFEDWHILANF